MWCGWCCSRSLSSFTHLANQLNCSPCPVRQAVLELYPVGMADMLKDLSVCMIVSSAALAGLVLWETIAASRMRKKPSQHKGYFIVWAVLIIYTTSVIALDVLSWMQDHQLLIKVSLLVHGFMISLMVVFTEVMICNIIRVVQEQSESMSDLNSSVQNQSSVQALRKLGRLRMLTAILGSLAAAYCFYFALNEWDSAMLPLERFDPDDYSLLYPASAVIHFLCIWSCTYFAWVTRSDSEKNSRAKSKRSLEMERVRLASQRTLSSNNLRGSAASSDPGCLDKTVKGSPLSLASIDFTDNPFARIAQEQEEDAAAQVAHPKRRLQLTPSGAHDSYDGSGLDELELASEEEDSGELLQEVSQMGPRTSSQGVQQMAPKQARHQHKRRAPPQLKTEHDLDARAHWRGSQPTSPAAPTTSTR